MGAEVRRLMFTKLLLLTVSLHVAAVHGTRVDGRSTEEEIRAARIQRDLDGVTTVLLVSARPGKSAPPVGVLTKTARTFVQDGASTEYATQVLGTTLDNGRLYAKILSTSSRVFYEKEPTPDPAQSPFVVYPSKSPSDEWRLKLPFDEDPIKIVEKINSNVDEEAEESTIKIDELTEPFLRENDVFNRRDNVDLPRFKPAKVRSAENLPTYTVKQDYVLKGFDLDLEEEQPKTFRPRIPKVFRPQQKVALKKSEIKPLATVTYHGFADFTTTVGDTVIVFSPSTAPAPVGRPATTIKGDATLRPDDGIAVLKIKPTNVVSAPKKTKTFSHGQDNDIIHRDDKFNDFGNIMDLQPSVVGEPEAGSPNEMTKPLNFAVDKNTASQSPTGLLKVIDSTTAVKGTTTHYMSSIYGTYIGTNYAQIIHTSSNVYFYPEDSTRGYSFADDDGDLETSTSKDESSENDELTTPYQDTTERTYTTLKNRPITESTIDDDLANDIIPFNNRGRSIKGGSQKNQFIVGKNNNSRQSEIIRTHPSSVIPSSLYKTYTYFTTFFIPGKDGHTTTSVRSREVVSSEISSTELISPSSTKASTVVPTAAPKNEEKMQNTSPEANTTPEMPKQEPEDIELIFKTLYTTYTYLTTFFQESTSSVSSREVVETNIITQTLGPNGASIDVAGLFDKEESVLIAPTKLADISPAYSTIKPNHRLNKFKPRLEQTTGDSITTLSDEFTTLEEQGTTEAMTTEPEEDEDLFLVPLEPSPIPTLQTASEQVKTYYTTYTYFTTIFVDDETEIETRTEVFSNVITETIQPTAVLQSPQSTQDVTTPKPTPPPEILAYLEALQRQKAQQEALLLANVAKEITTTEESTTEDVTDGLTTMEDSLSTEKVPYDGEVLGSMITDVISSSTSGGKTVLDNAERRNLVPEDQELSESNHHDVEPVPTLLLQTSFTTYTYFTTMYKGDETNVASRLETVTNVVTETVRPTAVVLPEPQTTQPLTYYTTFTYWTTYFKGGDTVTTSREETVSNVVTAGDTATPTVQLDVIKTYRPFVVATAIPYEVSDTEESQTKATSENEITTSANTILTEVPTVKANDATSAISPDPTTFYTTYTYFTTSYVGNSTILNSRLETVTSVKSDNPAEDESARATPRAIGGATSTNELTSTVEKTIEPTSVIDTSKTGLISTITSSQVNDGTTTHFMTDIYGTHIDGLYAQIVQSSTKLESATPSLTTATPVLPTGVLSLNKGSIIDADEITTVYFTTKQIGTSIDGLYAKVIESTSSTSINEEKLATQSPVHGHRTGLVRLIKGHIEANDTTTYYQSKVIGTSIDGRYAQIIESTSSYLIATPSSVLNIAPSSTIAPVHATGIPDISPTPAVIQSSLSEDPSSDEANSDIDEDEEEDEDGQKSKKKSRLTFSSRKRTFSPAIRPFASRNRPTFNPKRKPQGATTITRSDVTPTITATLAGKGNRFASSRGRVTSPIGPYSSTLSASSSRRFSGRRGQVAATSTYSSSFPAGSTRGRASVRPTASSSFSGSRRGSSSIRGSSARPASRAGASSVYPSSSSRYRPVVRPSSTVLRASPSVRQDDQEDNANEFTSTTLVTEETPFTQIDEGDETIPPTLPTTESPRRSTNPLLRFRRPPAFGSGVRSTTPKSVSTAAPRRSTARQTAATRNTSRTRTTAAPISTRPRQSQSGLFPPRGLFGRKPDVTEEPTDNKNENGEGVEENFEDDPVEEIIDNDYEGSEAKETAPASVNQTITSRGGRSRGPAVQIKPFAGYGRKRVRRQTSQLRTLTTRFRRPSIPTTPASFEERIDSDISVSKEDVSKIPSKLSRYGTRGRTPTNSRLIKDDISSEEYTDNSNSGKVRQKATSNSRGSVRVKPSPASTPNRQFTLREKENVSPAKASYKRPSTSSVRSNNLRTRSGSRARSGSTRYQTDVSSRRTAARPTPRSGSRTSNRRVPTRGRSSQEDYRELTNFDGTITVTHYVPTEVTIPVVNNGITEQRNIITAQPSTEVIGPDRYSTIVGGDGRPLVVLASEMTGTNAQGQVELTRFLLHETPTTRVSHMLTSSAGRRFSQPVVVPSTIYSIENVVSTIQPSLSGNTPLANILLSQLLLGQFGQPNPLLPGVPIPVATPTTRFDTRASTYVTTLTKLRSTVIPLTFRGKEILTTLVDSSTDVVTATELITDTVVVTPTMALPAANLNSLLLLLQQPQAPPPQNPLVDPLFAAAPLLTQSNTLPGEVERRNQPVDSDYRPDNEELFAQEDKPSKSKIRKNEKKEATLEATPESSVITLYVSGRRPGEFSTVLSTVKVGEDVTSTKKKRDVYDVATATLLPDMLQEASESVSFILSGSEEPIDAHAPTQSLESVVGDVGRHISTSIYT